VTSVFYAYRDSPQRRLCLTAPLGSADRYLLFGADELQAQGYGIRHNLERPEPPRWARAAGGGAKRGLELGGGYGGDFATVLASLRTANDADVVLSTVDTVGIPLMLLGRVGLLRRPLVYTAVGLPERLAQLRSDRLARTYAGALARCASVLAYSAREAEDIRRWLEDRGQRAAIAFVPFGVDTVALSPSGDDATLDVVSVGADPHRDFALLSDVARERPDVRFAIVASRDGAQTLVDRPANVDVEVEIPFGQMRQRLEAARVVALPVRENTYSGATTVLLQAMALGKPIVVSRTSALATGYGLVDGANCRLVDPGDGRSFGAAVDDLLRGDESARRLGAHARQTAERELGWPRYVSRIAELVDAAAASARDGSARG
jgi:glycosyltransferase involved in cell wall biosynthesis